MVRQNALIASSKRYYEFMSQCTRIEARFSIVNIAKNNSLHASSAHKSFFVNGHATHEYPSRGGILLFKGGGASTSKSSFNSCSSRVVTNDDACRINVEEIDIESKKPTNSDDTIVDELDISEEPLTEENNSLLAVRTKRADKGKTNESAEEFLLTRGSVIHFVQDLMD